MSIKTEKIISILEAGRGDSIRIHNEALEELIHAVKSESPRMSKQGASLIAIARRMIKAAERDAARTAALIDGAENETERELLQLHYVHGLSWGRVADKLGYSERQIYRLHDKAIGNLANQGRKGRIAVDERQAIKLLQSLTKEQATLLCFYIEEIGVNKLFALANAFVDIELHISIQNGDKPAK